MHQQKYKNCSAMLTIGNGFNLVECFIYTYLCAILQYWGIWMDCHTVALYAACGDQFNVRLSVRESEIERTNKSGNAHTHTRGKTDFTNCKHF